MSARTILTLANGRGVDLRNPKASDIDLDVMAEHLAKEARFNGATPGVFYSVAEHVVRGAGAILAATGDASLAAYFLLHDGHEHVLKDDTTPKKNTIAEEAEAKFGVLAEHVMASFASVTERHDIAIHAAAGLAWPPPSMLVAAIKRWDVIMFVTEWRDLMRGIQHPDWAPYRDIPPLALPIIPWPWEVAKAAMLKRCHVLLPVFNQLAHNKTHREQGGASA